MKLNKLPSKLFSLLTFLVVFLSAFLVSLLSSSLLHPVSPSNAADNATSNVDVNVTLAPFISITDTVDPVNINLTGTPTGSFNSSSTNIVVTTNNATGYTLTFSDQDTDTAMHHTNTNVTNAINSITTTNTTPSSFNLNTWGYSLDATSYHKIPLSTAPNTIKTTTTPTSSDSTTITFGANIDNTLPAGQYSDVVTFSATPNYVPDPVYFFPSSLTTMQQMTPAICSKVTTPGPDATTIVTSASTYTDPTTQVPQTTVTDTRDNKQYTIAKLADGRCWMTSNLRLGNEAITLTPADSDVSSNFSLPAAQTTVTSWGAYDNSSDVEQVRLYTNGDKWLSGNFSSGEMTVQETGTPDTPSRYIGNYYNWYTATAGTGLYDNTTENATSSICPKGWRLPTGGPTGEYEALYTALSTGSGYAGTEYKTTSSLALSGLYYYGGSIDGQGSYGYRWSSTPRSTTYHVYGLYASDSGVNPQSYNFKAIGYSVRCIAR